MKSIQSCIYNKEWCEGCVSVKGKMMSKTRMTGCSGTRKENVAK
jgi:hypothetical protein